MTKARLLERLRKLLALTASPNANEAAVARNKASKLMQEHGLSEQEVLDSDPAGRMFEMSMGAEGFSARWKFVLVALVARAHGCEAVGLCRGRLRKVKIVGTKGDAERASNQLAWLLCEIERITKIECSDPPDEILFEVSYGRRRSLRSYLDSFRRGAVAVLAEKMQSKKKPASPDPALGTLIVAGEPKAQARDHIKAKFPKIKQFSPADEPSPGIDDLAFSRGYIRGSRIKMTDGKGYPT